MTTDPIADMLTRIRNVNMVRQEYALVPWSKMKVAVAKVLKEEGFIRDFEVLRGKPTRTIKIYLKYKERNQPVIMGLKRVSKPGLRVYVGASEIPRPYGGLGVAIVSTTKGIMTGTQAWKQHLGVSCCATYGDQRMSRIGKLPIKLPSGVSIDIKGNEVTVKGPKGELRRSFDPSMSITMKDGILVVVPPSDQPSYGAIHGLTRALLANMVEGVNKGFEKGLEVVGVGYRAQKAGDKLVLQVGFTHPVEVVPPPGVSFLVEGTNRVKVCGVDKELVGDVAAKLRAIRKCDSYKGKGVKYAGEKIRLKPGKAGRAAAKK